LDQPSGSVVRLVLVGTTDVNLRKELEPGLATAEKAELSATKRRITELETELAVHRRASELLGKVVPPKGGSRRSR
jgi:hypothetical protein